jgi:hypothetical protein
MSREDDVLAKLAKLEEMKSCAPSRSVLRRLDIQAVEPVADKSDVQNEIDELSAKLAENHEALKRATLPSKTSFDFREFSFSKSTDDEAIFIVRDAHEKKLCEVWRLPDTMKGTWQIVSPWNSTTFDHDSLLAHLREISEKSLDSDDSLL